MDEGDEDCGVDEDFLFEAHPAHTHISTMLIIISSPPLHPLSSLIIRLTC